MALTVVVLSAEGARLTFDGTQRVVIGRGAGSDVRLPDASVSLRHASLRAQGSDFVVVDEGSTNGTFVGSVRVAAMTSRIVRSGDRLRVGKVWLELLVEQAAVTRDLALATRDIALALVASALDAKGSDRVARLLVVEGPDQGVEFRLAADRVPVLLGRGAHCEVSLADPDVSREHLRVERRGSAVWLTDAGTKNGTWLGETAIGPDHATPWKTPQMVRIGRTVLALIEPISAALAAIESAADEPIDAASAPASPPEGGGPRDAQGGPAPTLHRERTDGSPTGPPEGHPAASSPLGSKRGAGWSLTDALVMGAALCVLALSLAGLVWLLRG